MEIEKLQVVYGSNIWDTQTQKLIQMRLNIGNLELVSTNEIEGFSNRIKTLIPSLYSRKCAEGFTSGFFNKLDQGISIPEIIAHIAVELQTLAGLQTNFIKVVRTNTKAVYNVVLSYVDEDAGTYAALAAVEIVDALVKSKLYFIKNDIQRIKEIIEENQLAKVATQKTQYFSINHKVTISLNYVTKQRSILINPPLQQAL